MNGAGAVECAGVLQELVAKSSSNRYHFYYRIRTNSGTGAISHIQTNVGGLIINVAYRKDLKPPPGSYRLTRAGINPWGLVTFAFYQPLSCANGDMPYLLLKSGSFWPQMHSTWIATKTGNSTWLMTWGPNRVTHQNSARCHLGCRKRRIRKFSRTHRACLAFHFAARRENFLQASRTLRASCAATRKPAGALVGFPEGNLPTNILRNFDSKSPQQQFVKGLHSA